MRSVVEQAMNAVGRRSSPADDHLFAVGEQRVMQHCAAALVWLGSRNDGQAEEYARRAVAQHEHAEAGPQVVHRLATTRLNLAILLARQGEPAEAAHLGNLALSSAWRLCSTDLFLLRDLHHALAGYSKAAAFIDRYQDVVRSIHRDALAVA